MANALRTLCALALVAALTPGVFAQGRASANAAELASAAAASDVTYQVQALVPDVALRNDACVDRGPLFNSPGTHPGGGDESVLQDGNPALLETTFGFGAQGDPAVNNEMADDFAATPDCNDFKGGVLYSYQTGASAPTITSAVVTVYTNAGTGPGAPVGDADCSGTFTATTTFTNVYRVLSAPGNPANDRRIQRVAFSFPGNGCQVASGSSYWLGYQFNGSASFSGPWAPPVPAPLGASACPPLVGGPAQQDIANGGFAPVVNGNCQVDLPFQLLGQGGPPACSLSFTNPGIAPNTVAPGGTVTFTGNVVNAGPERKGVTLRATYDGPGSLAGSLSLGAASNVPPGTYPFSRPVNVPATAPSGAYVVTLQVINTATGDVCDDYTETIQVTAPRVGEGTGTVPFEVVAPDAPLFEASATTTSSAVSPNPFAGRTQIAYTVAATANVRLSVYDVLGREVAVLVDGTVEAGAHSATFDARGLSSGTYVYRLVVGSDVQTGRMTLAH